MANIVEIVIKATDKTRDGITSASSGFQGLGKVAGVALAATGVAIAATAVKGVMAFTEFQTSMNEVFTLLPGISQSAMDDMTGQVKTFSTEFGVLPEKVVPALYQALSAGVPPGNVFDFLETAQKAARGGVTDLETAVDGLSSVVNAYGSDIISAGKASDIMFTTVRLGKTTMEQLSKSLFNVVPVASALGVKFEDVSAAMAAMTAQGIPTSVATTQLRQLFVELSKSSQAASQKFEQLSGKSFKDFIAGGGNVQEALQIMEKGAAKAGLGINDLFGSVEAGNAALALTGKGTKTFTDDIKAMNQSAGATDEAFGKMQQGLGPIFDKIKAFGSVALINFGQLLAPAVETAGKKILDLAGKFGPAMNAVKDFTAMVMEKLTPALDDLKNKAADAFAWAENKPEVLAAIAAVIGTVLVAAFIALAASAWSAAAGVIAATWPILAVAAAIAALVAVLVYAWNNWDTFRNVVMSVVTWMQTNIPPTFNTIKQAVVTFYNAALAPLISYIQQNSESFANLGKVALVIAGIIGIVLIGAFIAVVGAIAFVIAAVGAIGIAFVALIGFLYNLAQVWWDVFNNIRNWVGGAVDVVENFIQFIWDMVNNVATAFANMIRAVWLGIQVFWDLAQNVASAGGRLQGVISSMVGAVFGFAGSVASAIGNAIGTFASLPGRIAGAVGNLGGLLWNAGASVINGLINGVESGIGRLRSLLGSITNLIPSWKGPLDVDRKLLEPSGAGIMEGLMSGIGSQVPALRYQLRGVTADIPTMAARASTAATAAAASYGGPPVVVNVQGSIRSDRDFIRVVRDELVNLGLVTQPTNGRVLGGA